MMQNTPFRHPQSNMRNIPQVNTNSEFAKKK